MKYLIFTILLFAFTANAKKITTQQFMANESSAALDQAKAAMNSGKHLQASTTLFSLARKSGLENQRLEIKYLLGQSLMSLKLYQVAAWQFVDVIRAGKSKFMKPAVEALSVVADELGDDTILNYAVSKIDLQDFPATNRDMLFFRIGQVKLNGGDYSQAISLLNKVSSSSRYSSEALYNTGLAYAEQKNTVEAIKKFKQLYNERGKVSPNDDIRVAAIAGIARTYYQAQDWDKAVSYYQKIPRDHLLWHDALFESSWAYLRAAKFRSALSNFQSLHSTYYEDAYVPESLLLRAIVYLYICKYDEINKVLDLFEKTYGPARAKMTAFLENSTDPLEYYAEIEKGLQTKKDLQLGRQPSYGRLPYFVVRYIIGRQDVANQLDYLRKLTEEKRKIESYPSSFEASSLGKYAQKIILNRAKNAKIQIADMMKSHLVKMRAELKDLYEQSGFLKYEMINGQKESLHKDLAGKSTKDLKIEKEEDRDFFVKNGYQYYPFRGEYWLDEVGNYFYLGEQACD